MAKLSWGYRIAIERLTGSRCSNRHLARGASGRRGASPQTARGGTYCGQAFRAVSGRGPPSVHGTGCHCAQSNRLAAGGLPTCSCRRNHAVPRRIRDRNVPNLRWKIELFNINWLRIYHGGKINPFKRLYRSLFPLSSEVYHDQTEAADARPESAIQRRRYRHEPPHRPSVLRICDGCAPAAVESGRDRSGGRTSRPFQADGGGSERAEASKSSYDRVHNRHNRGR